MSPILARWGGFGLAAAVAVVVASAMALIMVRVAWPAPGVSAAPGVAASPLTPSTTPSTIESTGAATSATPSAASLPVGVEKTAGATYYTVQPFDVGRREGTLAFIASRFGTTVAQLLAWNDIPNPNLIHPGQRLRVA